MMSPDSTESSMVKRMSGTAPMDVADRRLHVSESLRADTGGTELMFHQVG